MGVINSFKNMRMPGSQGVIGATTFPPFFPGYTRLKTLANLRFAHLPLPANDLSASFQVCDTLDAGFHHCSVCWEPVQRRNIRHTNQHQEDALS